MSKRQYGNAPKIMNWLREHQDIEFATPDMTADLGIPMSTGYSALRRMIDRSTMPGLTSPERGTWRYSSNGRTPAVPRKGPEELKRGDVLEVVGTARGKPLARDGADRLYVLTELEA